MQLGHRRRRSHPDSNPLKIRQRHNPRHSPPILSANECRGRAKVDRHIAPRRQITSRTPRQLAAQIVMALKQLPRVHLAPVDLELDRGTAPIARIVRGVAPKTPPFQLASRHIDNPIRLQPLDHVVVTSHRDEPARHPPASNPFRNRRRTNLGHIAIDNARKFVENYSK
jgi:hypothetical protein